MKKKIIALGIALGIMPLALTGCMANWGNKKAVDGGYFTSNKGDYVVLNESGGQIMDCWILHDSYVKHDEHSDGFSFVDKNGHGILVQGDSKIIRINNKMNNKKYIEYHKETDLIPYEQFYKEHK